MDRRCGAQRLVTLPPGAIAALRHAYGAEVDVLLPLIRAVSEDPRSGRRERVLAAARARCLADASDVVGEAAVASALRRLGRLLDATASAPALSPEDAETAGGLVERVALLLSRGPAAHPAVAV